MRPFNRVSTSSLTRRAEREFPVACHDIDAQQAGGLDHILAPGPQRGRRALPRIAAIEQQRAGALRADLFDQSRQVRKAAELTIGARLMLEIKMRERMREPGVRTDAVMFEQGRADQIRRLAGHAGNADVDARFSRK